MARRILIVLCCVTLMGCFQGRPTPFVSQPASTSPARTLLGYSVEGRPIEAYTFGRGPAPVLILGGFHGNERASVHVAEQMARLLSASPAARADHCIVVVPVVNPDGYVADTRKNARDVDLNRNFPTENWKPTESSDASHGGAAPLSEPESQIVLDLVRRLEPSLIISIHSITRNRQCNNFDGPGEAVAAAMAAHNGYPVEPSIGYPTPGSFGTWAGRELGIPTITLELPRSAPSDECWEANRDALVAAIHLRAMETVALGK